MSYGAQLYYHCCKIAPTWSGFVATICLKTHWLTSCRSAQMYSRPNLLLAKKLNNLSVRSVGCLDTANMPAFAHHFRLSRITTIQPSSRGPDGKGPFSFSAAQACSASLRRSTVGGITTGSCLRSTKAKFH